MDKPKISVLIPLYNRKNYAAQCIDSALNQTFQEDYEIIIRDDCSTDGVYEFVQKKYIRQIDSGKIKLFRNEKNRGERRNVNQLIRDARGKYIAFLHNDDAFLPHALQHLYDVAEKFKADVVHGSCRADFPEDGTDELIPRPNDSVIHEKLVLLSDDPMERLKEWFGREIFWDLQYNFFNRKFMLDNDLFYPSTSGDPIFFALWWIMLAKVLIKTPIIFYVRRDRPVSKSTDQQNALKLEGLISVDMEMSKEFDKLFDKVEIFKNNEALQYMVKVYPIIDRHRFKIMRERMFENGLTPEIFQSLKNIFKKYFGENYFYPMLFFSWIHCTPFNQRPDLVKFIFNDSK